MEPVVSNEITLSHLVEHWEQDTAAHAQMTKAWERKFDDQNKTLVVVVTKLTEIEDHLKKLNGSVSKHEQRHNSQDVLNAQMAMSLNQAVESLKKVAESQEKTTAYMLRAEGTVTTAKWIIGLIGLGTLATLIKSFFS